MTPRFLGRALAALLTLLLLPARADAHWSLPDSSAVSRRLGLRPNDLPDISGFGKITRAGNLWVKTTNIGVIGNPFTAISSDPSAQWPGPSGVEYLFYVGLWVGAVDPTQIDPARRHRVTESTEWRPRSPGPTDHIYEDTPGQPNTAPYVDDDGDGRLDEDPINGIDDDGDGLVDEDGASVAEQMFTCVMRDDQPVTDATEETHVPLGLQMRQTTYAFSAPDLRNVVYFEQEIENVSGHELDSVYVAWLVDQDVGPLGKEGYFSDDIPEPQIPQGPDPKFAPVSFDDPFSPNAPYREAVAASDPKYQHGACAVDTLHIHGFTMTDNDGDDGQTPGASTFLLLDHPTDLFFAKAPTHVGFRMYRYYTPGLPFEQGGLPINDKDRYDVISSTDNVDQNTGLIRAPRPTRPDDYLSLCSVGPFLHMKPGERVRVVWALTVENEDRAYDRSDRRHRFGAIIDNAIAAMLAYRGTLQKIPLIPAPDAGGRESGLTAEPGHEFEYSDCRDVLAIPPRIREVTSTGITWFDLDCNFCTGVANYVYRHWVAPHPPPNAQSKLVAGDHKVIVQWDNLPQYTVDPDRHDFDFAGYHIWKASGWKRPAGEIGPDEPLWELLDTYDYYGPTHPLVERVASAPGETLTVKTGDVLVDRAWVPGSSLPRILRPTDLPCLAGPNDSCQAAVGIQHIVASTGVDSVVQNYRVTKYPVGHWQLEDNDVHNGFLYFYSITAFDSSGRGPTAQSYQGRRSAIEDEGVIPQAALSEAVNAGKPYAVPNPYRGGASWDLAPDAIDPTGTHIDFMNLPADWTDVRIYTLSGDLVREIRPDDVRPDGRVQKETAADQEATWNLLSRNGQDVASGIYLFAVESARGARQIGRFVVIR